MRARLGGGLLLVLCVGALVGPVAAWAKEVRLPLSPVGTFTEPKGLAFDQSATGLTNQVYAIGGRSEVQQVTIAATEGNFRLKFAAFPPTNDLSLKAPATEVRDALRTAICPGESCVFVSGGPGDETGSSPYKITFGELLATTDVEELECLPGTPPLGGGSGCSVETIVNGVNGNIARYNADGTPAEFSALGGSNVIDAKGPGADMTPQGGLHFTTPFTLQVAVDESGGPTDGDIYVTQATDHLVDIFSPAGEFKGQLTEYKDGVVKPLSFVCGVAVDSSGAVYVADAASGIHKYVPAGNPVTNTDNAANFPTADAHCNLAAGRGPTAASLFAVRVNKGELVKLNASTGAVEYSISEGNTVVTVDPISGHVLTGAGTEVREYDASGASSAKKSGPGIAAGSTVNGVAVDGTPGIPGEGGTVYLSRAGVTHLDVYGPLVNVPVVEAREATKIGPTSTTLNGTISADGGPEVSCHFEYVTAAQFEATEFAGALTASCEPVGPFTGSDVNEVSAEVAGLAIETEYKFRLIGENSEVSIPSSPLSFETFGRPIVDGGKASHVTATTAMISGAIDPRGSETEAAVEYLTRDAFEATEFEGAATISLPNLPAKVTGTGNLGHATGNATTSVGSAVLTGLTTETGEFEAGQTVTAPGIPPETVIVVRTGGGLQLSKPATQSIGPATGKGDLTEGSATVTGFSTLSGSIVAGQTISGEGISSGTRILSCSPTCASPVELTLSAPIEAGGTNSAVTLTALLVVTGTSNRVTNLSTTGGHFGPGQVISGTGIPAGTTVLSATEGQLVLSKAATERVLGTPLSAFGPQPVSLELSGLTPDTSYVFRLVAQNEFGEAEPQGEAGGFSTFGPPGPPLPDGRAYEQVTPAEKAGEPYVPESEPRVGLGGSCFFCTPGFLRERMPMQATADGGGVAFEGDAFEGGLAPVANQYVARREASGWQSHGLGDQRYRDDTTLKVGFKALSADLSRAVVLQAKPALTPDASEGFANLYLQEEGNPILQTMITAEPEHRSTEGKELFKVNYGGANAGTEAIEPFSHVIFQANDALTEEVPGLAPAAPEVDAGERNLYEWTGGELRLVNVLPENNEAAPNAVIGSGRLLKTGTGTGNFNFAHAISDDGSRIFWSAVPGGQVYVREDGETTREVPDPGKFLTATPDGSKVLLSDGMVYDLEDETLTDLTEGQGGFQGIAGTSDDLSRVYFVDTKALGNEGEEGKPNLYLWEEGEVAHVGTSSFVATLLASDNEAGIAADLGTWHAAPGDRLAQASPDGRFLTFESHAPLTGFDSTIRTADGCDNVSHVGSPQCFEVFEYDADSQILACASCNPSEEGPLGPSNLALMRGAEEFFAVPQNLPPAGEGRLFFESQDALVQADTNGAIQDVYEWEPFGVGDCTRAGGCVALISNGRSSKDSHFLAADADGSNVFFTTRERLVRRDKDDFLDVYDARVGGGIDEGEAAPCSGETCRGQTSAPPPFEAPPSSRGEGEAPAPPSRPCKRGYVRRGGKCKRKHHPAKHKHRHHHRATHKSRGQR